MNQHDKPDATGKNGGMPAGTPGGAPLAMPGSGSGPRPGRKSRSLLKKLIRGLAFFVLGLLLLLVAGLAGAIIWLRTPSAEGQITTLLNKNLADVGGYSVALDRLSGPLPQRIRISNLRLGDKDGPLFQAKEVELQLDLGALLHKTAHIPLARVAGPELLRLPAPSGEPSPPSEGPPSLPDLTLPVAVKVDKILIEEAGVPLSVFLGNDPQPPLPGRLGPMPARLGANLSANAGLEGGKLAAVLKLDASTDTGQKVTIAADATMNNGKADLAGKGSIIAPLGNESMNLAYGLNAGMAGSTIAINGLNLDGIGLALDVQSGEIRLDNGKIAAKAAFKAEDGGLWRDLVAGLAGLASEQLRGITLNLASEYSKADQSAPDAIKARLNAEVKDLGPLAKEVSGPVKADISVDGKLDDLLATVNLSSPGLTTAAGIIETLAVNLNAAYQQKPESGMSAQGKFKLSTGKSPGGPGEMGASFALALPESADGSADLRDLHVNFAGVVLNGNLKAGIPHDKNPQNMRLDGKIAAEVKSWAVIAALSKQDLKGGPAKLALNLNPAAGQSADVTLSLDSLSLPGVSLHGLKLEARAEKALTAPTLRARLQTGSGAAGPLKWTSGSASVDGTKAGTFNFALKAGKGGDLLALAGNYNVDKSEAGLSRLAFNMPEYKAGVRLTAPLLINYANGVKVQGLRAAFTPGGTLEAGAEIKPDSMSFNAKLSSFPLAFLKGFSDAPLPDGEINAQASYAAAGGSPKGNFSVKSRVIMPAPAKGQTLNIQLDAAIERSGGLHLRGTGNIDFTNNKANGGKLNFSVPLAMNGAVPAPNTKGRMSATFNLDSPIAPLWRFVPMPGRTLDGRLVIDLGLAGAMSKPEVKGTVYMANGRFEDKLNGVLLRDMTLEAHGTPDGGNMLFSAADGRGGSIAMEGAVKLGPGQPNLALRGQLRKLQPLHRNDLAIMLSGLFGVKGPLASPKIDANIIVDRGEVALLSSLGAGGSVSTLNISEAGDAMEKKTAGPPCDISIEIPRRFFIRGRGLDSEWQGKLKISGNLSQPVLVGSLNPVRGNLELLSKTFKFTKGDITFAGGDRINPGLDLELTYTGSDITAVVAVGGSAKKPTLKLSSNPPLAQDEVLAHVLFGKSASELSQVETIQLANSIRELATGGGGGGLDPLTSVRKATGLDVLRVGGGQQKSSGPTASGMSGAELPAGANKSSQDAASSGPTLEAGKYINDRIYVGVEQGATQDSTGVRVEIELAPSLKLQGKTTPQSSQIGIGWKKDY